MAHSVFINYRVQDQSGYASLLYRELSHEFGDDSVFLAASSIRPGDDFAVQVFTALRQSRVLLAVIGPRWLDYGSWHDRTSVDFDWVRREIAEAFETGVRVIPILVEDAELPAGRRLPDDIAALANTQYLRLRHYSLDVDLSRIADELRSIVAALRNRPDDAAAATGPSLVYMLTGGTPACRIAVLPGDIRRVKSADVWVNSENTDMQMARFTEFSTSAVIRYWGAVRHGDGRVERDLVAEELSALVGDRRPVAPGTVLVTGSGALLASNNVRHIVHVATVQGEPGAGFRQVSDIGWCVVNMLEQVDRLARTDHSVRSALCPLFGTGMAGADIRRTFVTMSSAVVEFLLEHQDTPLRTIYFLAYSEREYLIMHDVLDAGPLLRVSYL